MTREDKKIMEIFSPKTFYEAHILNMAYCNGIDIRIDISMSHDEPFNYLRNKINEEITPIPATSG
jgi:hypothetical protein